MGKTIKQIAEEIGVTPQAIYQKKKQEPLSTALNRHSTKKGNAVYFDEIGQALIQQAFEVLEEKDFQEIKEPDLKDIKQIKALEQALSILEKELVNKGKTIESQQEIILAQQSTIRELSSSLQTMTDSLNKAQALHAGTIQSHLEALSEPEMEKEPDSQEGEATTDNSQASSKPPKGFWGRLFRK